MIESLKRLNDPGTIFFPPYVAVSMLVTLIWLLNRPKLGVQESFRFIFSREVWLSRTTWIDINFCLIYLIFLRTLAGSIENSVFLTALMRSNQAIVWAKGNFWTLHMPPLFEGIIATLVTMLSIDFATYVAHRLMHQIKPLWAIHSVHHSATQLTLLTAYRQHPLELIILNSTRGLFAGTGLALFHILFPAKTPVITISGLGAGFFLYMFTVNLQHSNVPVRYPEWVCSIFLSPHIHHIHHSNESRHHLCNFGVVFSFWDKFFCTYNDEKIGLTELRFGLGTHDPFNQSLSRSLIYPFILILRLTQSRLISLLNQPKTNIEIPNK